MNSKSGRQSPPNRRLSTKSGLNGLRSAGGGLTGAGPMNSSIISDTTEDPGILKQKVVMLERDLERRQESYISRERSYKTRIDELEEELTRQRTRKTGWMKTDAKFSKLKTMQGQIVNNVELVQDRTARILQEQERDLLRAFRARLFDVQTELEKEKSKKDDGAGAWIERSRQLEAEVEWAKEVADRLERANQSLSSENTRLKAQFKTQEDDRNYLIKQLVAVKKDNARLRAEYGAVEQENTQLQEQVPLSARRLTTLDLISLSLSSDR
jgi:chromosome segregation ATPase